MLISRNSVRLVAATAVFVITPLRSAASQEFGVYTGGGVGGIRDVRRPFGGGAE